MRRNVSGSREPIPNERTGLIKLENEPDFSGKANWT